MKTKNAITYRQKIAAFEIVDHGIDHAQYFQGCGVSFTEFDNVQTGCGTNAREAFDDALEQIAMAESSVDLSPVENSAEGKVFQTKRAERASVAAHERKYGMRKAKRERNGTFSGEYEETENELYYYVSIRYNLTASDEVAELSAGLHPSQTGFRKVSPAVSP